MREESRELFESFVGERGGAAHDDSKAGEVELLGFRALAEQDGDGRDKEEVADFVFDDALKHTSEAEFWHDDKRAATV